MNALQIIATIAVVIWLTVAGRAIFERDEKLMTFFALANIGVLIWNAWFR